MRRLLLTVLAVMTLLLVPVPTAGALAATSITLFTTNDAGPSGNRGFSVEGEPIFLVIDVTTVGGTAATGTASFFDGATKVGDTTVRNGIGVFADLALSGDHVYRATYSGDSNYSSGTSNNVFQTVTSDCRTATGQVLFPGPTVFRDGFWYLRTLLGPGLPAHCFNWGFPGAIPVMGDWDGNGTRTIGLYFNGTWYLRNSSTPGPVEAQFNWGSPGMIPVVGDWDANGTDTLGLYSNGTWYLRNSNTSGPVEAQFVWGGAGMQPVSGDWDGNGNDTIGLFRNGTWFLRDSVSSGPIDRQFAWGGPGMTPLAGDWNGDGVDTIGAFQDGVWYVRNSNSSGGVDGLWGWGAPGDQPVTGR